MTRLKSATIVLPLVVVLLGLFVPVLLDRFEDARVTGAEGAAAELGGRTSDQWAELAMRELERGRLRRALASVKTAEKVEPGTQFSEELALVRRALHRASEVRETAERFAGGPVDHLELSSDGRVASAHRLVTVLPGESLWSLARGVAAAEAKASGSEVSDAAHYRAWDRLTELNGVRELSVGERIRVPVPDEELAAVETANARDLELVAGASAALASGNVDDAVDLRAALATAFAETTVSCRELDSALAQEVAERDARVALAREHALMGEVREILADVRLIPRAGRHAERVSALRSAANSVREAESLREGVQYGDTAELVDRLLSEESRFAVRDDGTIVGAKAPGTSYTEAARQAVEWLLERELRWSGSVYPHSANKTADERAWARYLLAAASDAGERGDDFAALLEAVAEEREIKLPDPMSYFPD